MPHSTTLSGRGGDLIFLCCSFTFAYRSPPSFCDWTMKWEATHRQACLSLCSLLLSACSMDCKTFWFNPWVVFPFLTSAVKGLQEASTVTNIYTALLFFVFSFFFCKHCKCLIVCCIILMKSLYSRGQTGSGRSSPRRQSFVLQCK